jgi:endonuclease G, mitochondrial
MRIHRLILVAILTLPSPAYSTDGELHSFHCLLGCPSGAPATNDTVVREVYTLSSNDITKLADWVAYRITPSTIGPSKGRDWKSDAWLTMDETLKPEDYDGAFAALRVDRGHQAPLASFSGTSSGDETNILSNITPQSSALNQGPWARLEDQERKLAQQLKTAVYVYTGPLFERLMRPLPAAVAMHRVPSGYWKVVALADGRVAAFVFDQTTPRRAIFCDYRAPLIEIELRARLDLFPMAAGEPFSDLSPHLGCTTTAPARPAPSEIPAER